jgi:hypothetical protein
MAQVSFPSNTSEIKETLDKLFNRIRIDGDSSPTRILNQYDFVTLGNKQYPLWLDLDKQISELNETLRSLREQKEKIWKDDLRPALVAAKKVIVSSNGETPSVISKYGFAITVNPSKRKMSEKSLATKAKRLSLELNAQAEAKALASKSNSEVTITVDDVTKTNRLAAV